ncbi:hypothetical protein B0H10DRAFT_1959856 [Mycena sp. CBHHK59/15]|nr:hypothetical protein B0H10DRAFT_1959856 [Mycena sp. CBHHK59/15]
MPIKILTTPNIDLLIASEAATIPTVFDHSKCLPHHPNTFMHFGTHLSSAPARAGRKILGREHLPRAPLVVQGIGEVLTAHCGPDERRRRVEELESALTKIGLRQSAKPSRGNTIWQSFALTLLNHPLPPFNVKPKLYAPCQIKQKPSNQVEFPG